MMPFGMRPPARSKPTQPDLFESPDGTFGPVYDAERDADRLRTQHETIRDYMLRIFPAWRTLAEISAATGYPEASISAQLRHLRKPRFGSFTVSKKSRPNSGQPGGLWEYRVTPKSAH